MRRHSWMRAACWAGEEDDLSWQRRDNTHKVARDNSFRVEGGGGGGGGGAREASRGPVGWWGSLHLSQGLKEDETAVKWGRLWGSYQWKIGERTEGEFGLHLQYSTGENLPSTGTSGSGEKINWLEEKKKKWPTLDAYLFYRFLQTTV